MTAPEPSPTAEHIDAVARALLVQWAATSEKRTAQSPLDHCRDFSRAILTPEQIRANAAALRTQIAQAGRERVARLAAQRKAQTGDLA